MKPWAIYIRKSRKDEGSKAYRLEYQREFLPQYAKSQGWSYEVFDEGITTGTDIQKLIQLQKIISRLKEFDGILAIDYTRFSRDTTLQDYLFLINECAKYGIKLATPQTIRNPAIHSEWLLMVFESGLSAFEMKNTGTRMREGKKAQRDKGAWLGGRPPTGYRFNPEKRKLELEPKEAELVLKACQLSLDYSGAEIQRRLSNHKTRYGKSISANWLKRILADRRLLFYSGQVINSQGEIIPGEQPTIISDKLRREIIYAKRNRKHAGSQFNTAKHLLSGLGIAQCGYCGRSVNTRGVIRNPDKSYFYYRCSGRSNPIKERVCKKSRGIRIEIIEQKVISNLIRQIQNVQTIKKAYKEYAEHQRKHPQTDRGELISNQIEQRELEKSRLVKALRKLDNDQMIVSEIQELNQEISSLYSKLNSERKPQFLALKIGDLIELSKKIKHFNRLSWEIKREILKTAIKRIRFFNDRLEIEYNFPLRIQKILLS